MNGIFDENSSNYPTKLIDVLTFSGVSESKGLPKDFMEIAAFKINPLIEWTHDEVWGYIKENNLPYNVLHDQNYPSIGCKQCTSPVCAGDDDRSGRWKGINKTECGLHKSNKNAINPFESTKI